MLTTATQTAPVKTPTEAKKAATSAATKDDKAPSTSAAPVAPKDDKAPSTSAASADASADVPADVPAKKKARQRVYIVVGAVHEFTNAAAAEKFLNQDPNAPVDTTYQVIKGKMVQGKAKVSLR